MKTNTTLFNKISTLDGIPLSLELDGNFKSSLTAFRNVTSRIRTINQINYPVVYLGENDYGGLSITYGTGLELRLIVNLQFYYVYGFFLDDGNVYAFSGEAIKALTYFGFNCITIPYGDAYYDIKAEISEATFNTLLNTTVALPQLITALDEITNLNIPFTNKAEAILVVFWSLVEGIRFAGISNVVLRLLQNQSNITTKYSAYYNLAEHWSDLCVAAVNSKTTNSDIAVYDLDRVDN